MRKNNRKTAELRMKIGICIAIIIAVLIVKKFDGHEKNKFVGAVAEYYGRDYSVEDVVSAMSKGIEKAETIPDLIGGADKDD